MGRECRRVPADWEHPIDPVSPTYYNGKPRYIPKYDESYKEAAEQWLKNCLDFEKRKQAGQLTQWEQHHQYYWEYEGNPPNPENYMPDWPEEQRTHYQMYSTTSEGTPISPVLASPEELAQWCVDNKASIFADHTASYEDWMTIINGGVVETVIASNSHTTLVTLS